MLCISPFACSRESRGKDARNGPVWAPRYRLTKKLMAVMTVLANFEHMYFQAPCEGLYVNYLTSSSQ